MQMRRKKKNTLTGEEFIGQFAILLLFEPTEAVGKTLIITNK